MRTCVRSCAHNATPLIPTQAGTLHLSHRERSTRGARRVRGYKLASHEPPHPNPLPNGERETAMLAVTQPQSNSATARVQPPEAPLILAGKQATVKPCAGNCSRLVSFSMWQ